MSGMSSTFFKKIEKFFRREELEVTAGAGRR
nr:MAG TPA: hypothetical protein [Caudoviricetes sp.]